jgi:putative ABC transport system permease protein
LLIFQFSLSIFMIVCTIAILRQLSFFRDSNLGYDKEHLITIQLQGEVFNKYDVLKNALLKKPDILRVCRSEPLNGDILTRTSSIEWHGKEHHAENFIKVLRIDPDFAATYRIEMVAGRFFSEDFSTDKDAYVINQSAAEMMHLEHPLNQEITLWGKKGKIIGLTKNFHFSSLHHSIAPLIIKIPEPDEANIYLRSLSIRFKPGTLHTSMAHTTDTWHSLFPDIPCNFQFWDDALENQYAAEKRMSLIFNYFSVFAIFIACLGLYGLTLFSIEQKTKEIGIRRVLGASITGITNLFTKDIMKWIIIANFIAWPIAWYAMNQWLQNFAYRIEMRWWMLALAGGLALVIALLTVSWQAVRAATANPVEALRYE